MKRCSRCKGTGNIRKASVNYCCSLCVGRGSIWPRRLEVEFTDRFLKTRRIELLGTDSQEPANLIVRRAIATTIHKITERGEGHAGKEA